MNEPYVTLTAGDTSLVLDCQPGARPQVLYFGPGLAATPAASLKLMLMRQHAQGGADADVPGSLLNETASGLAGAVGFSAHRAGSAWASQFAVRRTEQPDRHMVRIICEDAVTAVCAVHEIRLDPASGVLACATVIRNMGETDLSIDWCAAVCMPLDPRADRLIGFAGRWASEFQIEEVPRFTGSYLRENRSGRTSHDAFPGLLAAVGGTTEQNGLCAGFHLAWSGNSRLRVDRLSDGRAFVQAGELFFPGEKVLAPGETYRTPALLAATAGSGLSDLSQKFHHHVRREVMDGRIARKPRPVHFNTWEAVYFDHDMTRLKALADLAAEVGAERYVLDDGWFGGRRNDKAGLGDWWVSPDVYPNGLGPLISHVRALGMEFGIWVEPEMVNADSDLFRAHPDWVLKAEGLAQVPFRNQYVLDLTRPEVLAYLFRHLDAMLRDHEIAYVKWDMNRDVHHPGSRERSAGSAQVRAVYGLIDALRAAHTDVEIESCSSGGARADYGILARTDRLWTSDSNDALDRQLIQRGASHFFPLEVLGTHVGPETCHITGRRLSMDLRVATAFFGHMGLEVNLLKETPSDLATLKAGIALHKVHRALLHSGRLHRLDTPAHVNATGIVSQDEDEALFSWCNLAGHRETLPGRFFPVGLDPSMAYRLRIIWPDPVRSRTSPSILEVADLAGAGAVFTGEALMNVGVQVPLLNPETCLIFHLAATGDSLTSLAQGKDDWHE